MNYQNNRQQMIDMVSERNLRLRRDLREAGSNNELRDMREQQLPRDARQNEYREPARDLKDQFKTH